MVFLFLFSSAHRHTGLTPVAVAPTTLSISLLTHSNDAPPIALSPSAPSSSSAKMKAPHGSLGSIGVKAKGGRGLDAGIFVFLALKELVNNVLAL